MAGVLLPIYKLDLSDRREVVKSLLSRLTLREQKAWLDWCCTQLDPLYRGTCLEGPVAETAETWHWLVIFCTQYGLNFEQARANLEMRVRLTLPVKGRL